MDKDGIRCLENVFLDPGHHHRLQNLSPITHSIHQSKIDTHLDPQEFAPHKVVCKNGSERIQKVHIKDGVYQGFWM